MAAGRKTGGRAAGSANKDTVTRMKVLAGAGLTPLDYMMGVLNDPEAKPEDKKWASQAAAPYVHAKLASVEVGNKGNKPFVVQVAGSDAGLL